MKKLMSLMALFVVSMLAISMVSALSSSDLEWGTVKINGDLMAEDEVLAIEEGQTLEIRVGLVADNGAEDIEVEAKISGYEYSDYEGLVDATHLFNINAGTTKYVNLEVNIPTKLEKDEYWLRLRVLDQNSEALVRNIRLAVEPARHGLDIADVVFSPGNTVKAGRSLLTTVLLQNFGDNEEEDVKVSVSIPELGVTAVEYMDSVETDNHNIDYEDVPEMFLPIPATAAEGDYEVRVAASYDEYETVVKSFSIHVLANEMFQEKEETLVLAVGPEAQTIAAGSKATYALALTNAGDESKAYWLEVMTGDWATASLSDNLVVLETGKNKVVYVDLTVSEDAAEGAHTASLIVKSSDNEVLQTIPLKANVAGSEDSSSLSLRNGLEIALIVLVVLLVIIGLIIGFGRLRKDDEDDEEEQDYY